MKPCFGRVCVWLICRDVKLRRLFVFCLCRGHAAIMQTHANEAMHDGGSRGWSPWCTCIVVTTCCSGFASIQLSMSGDGKRLNPRTSKSILFLHGCHNLYFRRNHVADVFCSFRRNHIADCILIFSSISCRQCILMTFLDMETMQENFYYLKMHRWFLCFLSNLHVSGFSSCRITQMIHSCLVCARGRCQCVLVYTALLIHTYVLTHVPTPAHAHTCMHACIHRCIHTNTYTHTCMHAYIHTYMHASIHTSMHTFIHTYIHTCLHS